MKKIIFFSLIGMFMVGCNSSPKKELTSKEEAQTFIDSYTKTYQELYTASSEAEWALNTKIIKGDTLTGYKADQAGEAYAAFTGSEENINQARKFIKLGKELTDIQQRQLNAILYMAGANPAIAKDIVTAKIKAETAQTKTLFGYDFQLNGKSVSANQIDSILVNTNDLNTRLAAWKASKGVGTKLRDGLIKLRDLRNGSVQALGYLDYFAFQVSDYGMESEEMLELNQRIISEIWPLYRELHTWARYELAKKYEQPVPEMLPAHWLPNRWGQEWSSMINVEGLNFDKALEEKGVEWIMTEGEDFYVSLGYKVLPKSFYAKSSLYPLPEGSQYKKNNHASAWHMNLSDDVRSLMSVEPNMRWWGTVLHELGHIYYYQAYSTDKVPILLRGGANRAYHEAIGTLIGLASMQKPFLADKGLAQDGMDVDEIQGLLKEALEYIVVMPWASGVMTEFEYKLYSKDEYNPENLNKTWWDLKLKYQGIVPPSKRGEEYCDAASKTHINNDAAQYYDYALANVMLFQFHMHIAKNILKQDPHATNYYGSKETGVFLNKLMAPGATVDWRENLQATMGEEISANAIVEYFEPLLTWLRKENEGRKYTLPEGL